MVREIITINVGGCGVNLGQTLNEQYCVEQGISCHGDKECKTKYDDKIPISFDETNKGKYVAKTLMIDYDPYSMDCIKNNKYRDLFHSDCLISAKSDACNNFAAGFYGKREELIYTINEKIRAKVENSGNFQGFIINHSISGGTGSGLGAKILERLKVDYRKKCILGFELFGGEYDMAGTHAMDTYNSLLCLHWLLDHTNVSIMLENGKIHEKCLTLGIKAPGCQNYNHLLNKLISSITAPSRYQLNESLNTIHMDFVPFPRLHFLIASMSGIAATTKNNNGKKPVISEDIRMLTAQCAKQENWFVNIADFDSCEDRYMSIKFNYRGNKIQKEMIYANGTMSYVKANKLITFAEIVINKPCMTFIDDEPPKALPGDETINGDKQVTMLGNNTCISRKFSECIAKKYDLLYHRRSYVHWYVQEGMEEGEFHEAREDLGFLEKDYLDVLCEQATDEWSESED